MVICLFDPQHAASLAAYAARSGVCGAAACDRPRGQRYRRGQLAQPLMSRLRAWWLIRGNFDGGAGARARADPRHPIALVNSVNPFRSSRPRGEDSVLRGGEELGRSTRCASRSATRANITAYWKASARPATARVCSASSQPVRARWSTCPRWPARDGRQRDPHRQSRALVVGDGPRYRVRASLSRARHRH